MPLPRKRCPRAWQRLRFTRRIKEESVAMSAEDHTRIEDDWTEALFHWSSFTAEMFEDKKPCEVRRCVQTVRSTNDEWRRHPTATLRRPCPSPRGLGNA